MVFAWVYWQREQSWQEMQAHNTALQQTIESQRRSEAEGSLQAMEQLGNYRQSLQSMYAATISGLEWGANRSSEYHYGELPLGDARLKVIEELTNHLSAIDFSGVIRISTHVANFCLTLSGPEGYVLADDNRLAAQCDSIGIAPGEAYELGLEQSVAFANYIRLAGERSGGRIRYEIISLGNSDPLLSYPATIDGVTAGDWNRIAAANNRVDISIIPDVL